MKKNYYFIFITLISFLILDCGNEFDLSQLPIGQNNTSKFGDTTYIAVKPDWYGFNKPKDIIVGNEPLIYVANKGNNEILCLDLSGKILGRSSRIKNPTAIAEDFLLDLIVCGEFDTTISNNTVTYGAIFRIKLFNSQNNINAAEVRRVFFDKSKPNRRYTGVTVMSNNTYYITRTGPDNSSTIDPDEAVLLFNHSDELLTPISNLKPNGTGLESISELTSISVINPRITDFVFTQKGAVSLFKLQWITFIQTTNYSYFASKFSPSTDGFIDILKINRFIQPEDVTVDRSGNIFVIDSGKDSLFRFTSKGTEKYSFGGHGNGEGKFNQPCGVAFFDKTLYIADTGNDRIVRFMLSIDLK